MAGRSSLLFLGLVHGGACWGPEGHRATAQIAADSLSHGTSATAAKILGGQSLANVATWADDIKHESAWSWTEELHFANVPRGQCDFSYSRDCHDSAGVHGNCVVGAIANYSGILRRHRDGSGTPEAEDALKFLVHLVGDIHQPLHVSWGFDKGGNLIKVEEGFDRERRMSLHQVWDHGIIDRELEDRSQGWEDWAHSIGKRVSEGEARSWSACLDDPGQDLVACLSAMADESLKLACSKAYRDDHGELVHSHEDLDDDYYESRAKVVDQRMAQGGVRLAALLRRVLRDNVKEAPLLI